MLLNYGYKVKTVNPILDYPRIKVMLRNSFHPKGINIELT